MSFIYPSYKFFFVDLTNVFYEFYSHLGYIYGNNKEKKKRVSDLVGATTLASEISR